MTAYAALEVLQLTQWNLAAYLDIVFLLMKMVTHMGFEPMTNGVRVRGSATELMGCIVVRVTGFAPARPKDKTT